MTTGSISVGSPSSENWYVRSWVGQDGKPPEDKPQKRFYQRLVRTDSVVKRLWRYERVFRKGKWRRIRVYYDITVPRKVYEQVDRGIGVYYRPPFHDLTCNIAGGTSVKSTAGRLIPISALISHSDLPLVWTDNDQQKLLAKLSSKVKGHNLNLGIALAEGRKTASTVVNTILRFTRSIRALKKGRLDMALRHLGAVPQRQHKKLNGPVGPLLESGKRKPLTPEEKRGVEPLDLLDVSKLWLEIQYGWTPLLKDVFESSKAFETLANRPRSIRYTASHRVVGSKKTFTAYYDIYQEGFISRRIIYQAVEALSSERTLGLVDPRPIIWELIPFSFVADWFIPIGVYLDNLATIPAMNGTFCQTEFIKRDGSAVGKTYLFTNAHAKGYEVELYRKALTSLQVPKPGFKGIKNALSVPHLKNALALLHAVVLPDVKLRTPSLRHFKLK